MRFHVLAIPYTATNEEYSACAYTQKVLKFCKMMHTRGHIIYHYGHEKSKVLCTEHISVTDDYILAKAYPDYDYRRETFKPNSADFAHTEFIKNVIPEITKRKQPKDFLLLFWGHGHKPIADAHLDLIAIEPGIGHFNKPCTEFATFESYSVMHTIYGKHSMQPRWMDAVVPLFFDPKDAEPLERLPGPSELHTQINTLENGFVLFLGRIIELKGLKIAGDATKETGDRLVVCGQGSLKDLWPDAHDGTSTVPKHIHFLGYVEPWERRCLFTKAKCVIMPTYYAEPFGAVQMEAQMAGLPVITTDWGAFPECIIHGRTGYRCRVLEHFVWALKNIDKLDRRYIRTYAHANYSLERVAPMFEEFFDMVLTIYGQKGFYQLNPQRTQLDWLNRYF